MPKELIAPKFLDPKNFGPRFSLFNYFCSKNIFDPKSLCQKKFGSQKIGSEKILVKKEFRFKKILV